MISTGHRYIVRDEQILSGEPVIGGHARRSGLSSSCGGLGRPEEIPASLPHLNLAQVFDALSYYSDHQQEINRYIDANRVDDDRLHPSVKSL